MNMSIESVKGPEWRKDLWNEALKKYKCKSSYKTFETEWGETAANKLYIKISEKISDRNNEDS